VGKTYLCCAGLKVFEKYNISEKNNMAKINPVKRLLDMAFEMMEYAKTVTYHGDKKLRLKIGINVGDVIAGVIGGHKPQFSLIGDTVNTASRLCSTGLDEKITLSSEAKKTIESSEYIFSQRFVEVFFFFPRCISFLYFLL